MRKKYNIKILIFLVLSASLIAGCATAPEMAAEIPVTGNDTEEESMMEAESDSMAANSDSSQSESVVEEAAEESMAEPLLMPVMDVPEPLRTLEDSDSSLRAYENRVLSGDNFLQNLYERPFTSVEMVYQPDLDIRTVDFAEDEQFFYFTITLGGMNPDEWGLNGLYGVEFDRTLTGRGDLFVRTIAPAGTEWSADSITILTDENGDVGGPQPMIPDTGFSGSGYDGERELSGEQSALARISPEEPLAIQIAVSRALLGNPEEFTWGAWADNGLRDFGMYDYHDNFGLSEAGSPFRNNEDYPIDALYNVDNTCRLPYGSPQMGSSIPGVCVTLPPAPEPESDEPSTTFSCPPGYVEYEGQCILIIN